ncbi:MAG: CoA transferase [Arenicella sp.]|nr:CoA transferase [Arenicella sp.]
MGPLKGLKVIEMAAIGPVPFAGMLLADMGADVVLLDRADATMTFAGDIMRRGKRAITVDMKSADGVATAQNLINKADILMEGYRPGVMERFGIGPDECMAGNPGLIYGRMTGWGQSGPLSQTAGHDINYISITGALNAMGRSNETPPPPLNLVGDYGGGSMFLVMGILAALHERSSSGKGQVIDAAITEGTASLMTLFYTMHRAGMWSTRRQSNLLDSAAHFYDTYETSDGKFISLGAIEPQFYALMKEKMGLDEELFAEQNNPAKWPQLKAEVADVVKTKSREEWCEIMEGTDVCFAPVLDYMEATQHHHMQAREAYIKIDDQVQPAPAPRFSRTPSTVDGANLGAETDAAKVLKDWA